MGDKIFDDFSKEIDSDYRDIKEAKFDDEDDEEDFIDENNDGKDDDREKEDDESDEDDNDDDEDDDEVIGSEKEENKSEHKKPRKSFLKKIMNLFIAIIILLILFAVVAGLLLKFGIDDLNDDDNYLLIVQNNNVAKSGTLFKRSSNEETIINIESFSSLNKISDFYEFANSKNKIDRLLVFDLSAIREYSEGSTFEFRGNQIEINMFVKYLSGEEPIPEELRQNDVAEWETRSHILGDWIDAFHKNIFTSVGKNYKRLADDYRQNRIIVYPSNSALFVIKFIPIEKVIGEII